MITLRPSQERGHANHGWLDTYHSFSFANYYDPQHMGFRHLRVINEDQIAPGHGFGAHSHRDMEILTYVLAGALEHRDSIGNGAVITPGEVQRMSAGRGITHSEYNHSPTEPVHLLQIWILPNQQGVAPSYEQRSVPLSDRQGHFHLIASPDGREGSVILHQDVQIYSALLSPGDRLQQSLSEQRHAWLQVARGALKLNDQALSAGDGAAISEESLLNVEATTDAEVLLFDLA